MKKIMFKDKYGLTQAVLAKRKTQTRRIIPSTDHENRRYEGAPILTNPDGTKSVLVQFSDKRVLSAYAVGEVLPIAQAYKDIPELPLLSKQGVGKLKQSPGWRNKMFVKPSLMPHYIRITDIRVERLQDISDEDCMEEGIIRDDKEYLFYCQIGNMPTFYAFPTPQSAYASLIDKVSGKGTWESNPYVFVYDFELID
mgnify:CR=1 FL=1